MIAPLPCPPWALAGVLQRLLTHAATCDADEAIAALREACDTLADHSLGWADVIHYPPPAALPAAPEVRAGYVAPDLDASDTDWNQIIARILENPNLNDRGRTFLADVRDAYHKYGHLSLKQANAVRKFQR